jgi:hypothetical protein
LRGLKLNCAVISGADGEVEASLEGLSFGSLFGLVSLCDFCRIALTNPLPRA